jgi:hypothetical protein
LLDSGFSTIAGIWADHDHFFPYYCLEFIRFVLEYGFLSLSCTKKILLRLSKSPTGSTASKKAGTSGSTRLISCHS